MPAAGRHALLARPQGPRTRWRRSAWRRPRTPSSTSASPAGCSPIATAITENAAEIVPQVPETLAQSLAIGAPGDGSLVVDAVRSRGGSAAAVPDGEIITAMELLAATEGVLTEPAGGTTRGGDDEARPAGRDRPRRHGRRRDQRQRPEDAQRAAGPALAGAGPLRPGDDGGSHQRLPPGRRRRPAPPSADRSTSLPAMEMPEVDGVSHRWVEARGLDFHVAEAGEGDDVVLCLHGWPQNWYEWRHLMPALAADGHRVLAMDLRGYGWSDAPATGRLPEGEHGRRRARRPRRARPRAGQAGRPRLGRLDRLPARDQGAAALRAATWR